eukprot:PhM_4_TR1274/c1_g1_i2/m.84672
MVKQRMNAVDVAAAIAELQHLIGTRLQNVYDVTQQVYILKFARGDVKESILVESGIRLHRTRFNREKPRIPSSFTMKLRKHIRNWRVESIQMLGRDRVVDFCFGIGDSAQHLLIELYAKGNVVLTDAAYSIVALLRTHKEEDVKIAVRETYPMATTTTATAPVTKESLMEALEKEMQSSLTLKQVLTSRSSCGPSVIEHCLMGLNIRGATKLTQLASDTDLMTRVVDSVIPSVLELEKLVDSPAIGKGYLVKKLSADAATAASGAAQQYEDFSPLQLRQFTSDDYEIETLDTFNDAVDVFFAALESKKIEVQEVDKEKKVEGKKERFLREHQRRLDELEKNQGRKEYIANLI